MKTSNKLLIGLFVVILLAMIALNIKFKSIIEEGNSMPQSEQNTIENQE